MPEPTRSSTILGSDTEMVLKTRPALSATTMKSPKITIASLGERFTSADFERAAAWPSFSSGTIHK